MVLMVHGILRIVSTAQWNTFLQGIPGSGFRSGFPPKFNRFVLGPCDTFPPNFTKIGCRNIWIFIHHSRW